MVRYAALWLCGALLFGYAAPAAASPTADVNAASAALQHRQPFVRGHLGALTAIRSGVKPGADAMPHKSDAEGLAPAMWPAPVVALFLGHSDVDRVMQAAHNPDATVQRNQLCEAYYYSGEYLLALGQTARGADLIRRASDTCPQNYIESEAAQVRQAQLGL